MKVTSVSQYSCETCDIDTNEREEFWRTYFDFDVKVGTFIKTDNYKDNIWVGPYCKLNGLEVFNLRKSLNK